MAKKHTAQCACDAVKFEFNIDLTCVTDCCCKNCQTSSGSVMATYFAVPGDDFAVFNGTPRTYSYTADSGKRLERKFCPDCEARLFTNNLEPFPGTVFLMIGSLDNPDDITPYIMEIFTKRRLKWTKELDVPSISPAHKGAVAMSPVAGVQAK